MRGRAKHVILNTGKTETKLKYRIFSTAKLFIFLNVNDSTYYTVQWNK